jgi:hypothetical protein
VSLCAYCLSSLQGAGVPYHTSCGHEQLTSTNSLHVTPSSRLRSAVLSVRLTYQPWLACHMCYVGYIVPLLTVCRATAHHHQRQTQSTAAAARAVLSPQQGKFLPLLSTCSSLLASPTPLWCVCLACTALTRQHARWLKGWQGRLLVSSSRNVHIAYMACQSWLCMLPAQIRCTPTCCLHLS